MIHDHTSSVLPWPNGMPFTLDQFIAVVESRMKVAHETLTVESEDSVGAERITRAGL